MDILKSLKDIIDRAERPTFQLEEGKDASVEIARSGTFHAHVGGEVKLTPEDLKQIAGSFADPDEHLLKIGHGPIVTDTPHYGNVTSLAYDEAADRLRATIKPTPALIRRNREEGFRRVSMEVAKPAATAPWQFMNLSFLGAKRPAIRGLAPVELAAGDVVYSFEEGDVEYEFAVKPQVEPSFSEVVEPPVKGDLTDPATMEERTETHKESEMEDKARISELEAKLAANEKRMAELAAGDVKRFMDDPKIVERVPLGVRPKTTVLLTALASAAANGETIQFAEGNETKEVTLYELAKDAISGMTPQINEEEKKRISDHGDDAKPQHLVAGEFSGVDEETAVIDFEARRIMRAAEAKGEKIDYIEALRRVELAGK